MGLSIGIREFPENAAAPFGARATRFCTNATMLVVLRVLVTFCPARRARPGTRLHHPTKEFRVPVHPPRQDPRRRRTHVRAVEIETNTPAKSHEIGLVEASVGASEAG